ncbi:MAG: dienelactone hydrolase, partial [Gammaproteobacteria bacterium]|nr:dienelactone hydrolase [Gammaproteobacteria bacterium]
RPDQLRRTFARYGRTSRVPTLWMYSANDRLWGPRFPRQWYRAFVAAGGAGRFVELPADKNNGHFIFDRNAKACHPAFRRFLASIKSRM